MSADLPVPAARAEEVASLDRVIRSAERLVTLDHLIASGRQTFRVVNRAGLLRELLRVVEVFVAERLRSARTEVERLVAEHEVTAREEGRHRVLSSFADLADLVDGLVATLQGSENAAAAKALDRRIARIFKTHGFERIPCEGVEFDSGIHEIVDEVDGSGLAANTVVREVSRGYRSGEYVLRVARVVVAAGGD